MRRLIVRMVAAISVSVVLLACGSGGDNENDAPTLEEYFAALASLPGRTAYDAISTPDLTDPAFANRRDEIANLYRKFAAATEDNAGELAEIDPPDEVEENHDRLVDAARELAEAQAEAAEEIAAAASDQQLNDELSEAQAVFDALLASFDEPCNELHQIADANGIEVDLECDD